MGYSTRPWVPKLRLEILDATDAPSIYEVRVLKVKGD